jgi:hypothetical protein
MTWPATHAQPTANLPAANGQTAPDGSQPDSITASPSINTSATNAPGPTTREQAFVSNQKAGIGVAELYYQLSPYCSQPSSRLSLDQIAAYLALAAQAHKYTGETIAALVEMQAEAFAQRHQK